MYATYKRMSVNIKMKYSYNTFLIFVSLVAVFFCRLNSSSGVISDGSGNYSVDSKCAWVLDTGQPNVTVRFRLDSFATECAWDHLYVYDGDSIYSTLVAAFRYIFLIHTVKRHAYVISKTHPTRE